MFPPNGHLSYKNFMHEIGERMKSQKRGGIFAPSLCCVFMISPVSSCSVFCFVIASVFKILVIF